MDGAEVGVLEEPDEVRLGGLLEREHGVALEAQIRLEVLGDLPHEALERQLADEQIRALLVLADLPQRHRAGPVAVGLLHAAGGRGRLPRRLKRKRHNRNRRSSANQQEIRTEEEGEKGAGETYDGGGELLAGGLAAGGLAGGLLR
uniref:Uncharacterized protein n=1 Tax=Aegilops tauschii subsp. strangulata TaxID=200361 RepID=A0A453MUT6_AEGTS